MIGFTHKDAAIIAIKKFTEDTAQKQQERVARDIQERDDALASGKPFPEQFEIYEGIVTTPEVIAFAKELRKKHPDYKFGINTDCEISLRLHARLYHELWVYREGEHYALGRIGYRYTGTKLSRHRTSGDEPKLWFVVSRKIENNKYSDTRWQYNAQMSKDFDKIVKASEKYLRAYAAHEVSDLTKEEFTLRMRSTLSTAERDLRNTQHSGADLTSGEWVTEFRTMLAKGYEFAYPKVRDKVQEIVMRYDEAATLKARPISGYHIQTSAPKWGDTEQHVYITEYNRLQTGSPDALPPVRYAVSSLPEDIRGKLAVVMMLTDGKHVDGVGYRINEDQYWVMKDTE